MERNNRKIFTGIVTSNKMEKTITVEVTNHKKSPLYGKLVKVTKKIHAHDEEQIANIGDKVRVVETRPLSKTKSFRLLEVVTKSDLA
ncbi:30S ribosomal protein S17 [Haploplasma modicum]|jgi:small subunit ribosomal protein S17|uniref:30S ribosomal protein S17 n=1 Tax=Haploplasma modicum TaxID=2150 RepID=UPI00047AFF22|nr:30S ribosomal protein S17 [Haploplasma modicum]MCR1808611.1 30S ribosomal protein S17 [Haploplasma modicum]